MITTGKAAIKSYEILETIGQGAYGIVYRAHQTSVDRAVAFKVILPEYTNQPDFIRRYESEALGMKQLTTLMRNPSLTFSIDPCMLKPGFEGRSFCIK